MDLKAGLEIFLKDAAGIALLGVGSPLRGDDAAGTLVAEGIDKFILKKNLRVKTKVFFGLGAPENITGEIKKFSPTHLVIIDAADFSGEAGSAKVFSPSDIGGASFSTHRIPLKLLSEYLLTSLSCEIIIVGIKPLSLEFGRRISPQVQTGIDSVVDSLQQILSELFVNE